MLISRFVTIFLAPIGVLCSSLGLLPLSFIESISGALFGYSILFIINTMFKYFRGIDGIGEGDFDLLFFIGSFTGIFGCWISILIGSLLGSIYSIVLLVRNYTLPKSSQACLQTIKIPFGPFLSLGAIIFVFIEKYIFYFFIA